MFLQLLVCVAHAHGSTVELETGWRLASSEQLPAGVSGAEISRPSFDDSTWLLLHHFPSTVLAALSSNGSALLPGDNFSSPLYFASNLNATNTSMFDAPWWYRAPLPPVAAATVGAGGRAIVTFRGVNYRANIWCNGRLVANSTSTAGAYLYHDVDVTDALLAAVSATTPPGDQPGLAVEVYRSYDWGLDCKHDDTIPFNQQVSCRGKTQEQAQDLAITFVDWAPAPHDANMGLWRGVGLELAGGSGAVNRAAHADTSAAAAAAATATTVAATAAAAVTVRYP